MVRFCLMIVSAFIAHEFTNIISKVLFVFLRILPSLDSDSYFICSSSIRNK